MLDSNVSSMVSSLTMLQSRPLLPRTRPSVLWATQALHSRGFSISEARVRSYLTLLQPPVQSVVTGKQLERRFTEADIDRLEIVVILKELGLTHTQVTHWLQDPQPEVVVSRTKRVRALLARATQLVESVKIPGGGQ